MSEIFFKRVRERTMGGLPISIASSLAIESVCGLIPELDDEGKPHPLYKPGPPAINTVDELWINVRTLFRNFMGSLETDTRDLIMTEHANHGVYDDMLAINEIITNQTQSRVKVNFYYATHRSIERKFPHAKLKVPHTPKQLAYALLESKVCAGLEAHQYDVSIDAKAGKSFIITHHPVDLLSNGSFSSLRLLESHTGKIKPHTQWNTKLQNGNSLLNIPFNRLTLQVFGDGVTFGPMHRLQREVLLAAAEKYRWSPVTTKDKVIYAIKEMHDPQVMSMFLSMLK